MKKLFILVLAMLVTTIAAAGDIVTGSITTNLKFSQDTITNNSDQIFTIPEIDGNLTLKAIPKDMAAGMTFKVENIKVGDEDISTDFALNPTFSYTFKGFKLGVTGGYFYNSEFDGRYMIIKTEGNDTFFEPVIYGAYQIALNKEMNLGFEVDELIVNHGSALKVSELDLYPYFTYITTFGKNVNLTFQTLGGTWDVPEKDYKANGLFFKINPKLEYKEGNMTVGVCGETNEGYGVFKVVTTENKDTKTIFYAKPYISYVIFPGVTVGAEGYGQNIKIGSKKENTVDVKPYLNYEMKIMDKLTFVEKNSYEYKKIEGSKTGVVKISAGLKYDF